MISFVNTNKLFFASALLVMVLVSFVCSHETVEVMQPSGLSAVAHEAHNVVHSLERLIRAVFVYVLHWII